MTVNSVICFNDLTRETECLIPSLKIGTLLRQVFNHIYRYGNHLYLYFIALIKLLIHSPKDAEGQDLQDYIIVCHFVIVVIRFSHI